MKPGSVDYLRKLTTAIIDLDKANKDVPAAEAVMGSEGWVAIFNLAQEIQDNLGRLEKIGRKRK